MFVGCKAIGIMTNLHRLFLTSTCYCAALVTFGCSSNLSSTTSKSNQTYNLKGSITVVSERQYFGIRQGKEGKPGEECFMVGPYSDIAEGMKIVVKNGKGEILAIGSMSGGKFNESGYTQSSCTFKFLVNNIPKSDFYIVEGGRRGENQYSFAEMEQSKWNLEYSLGSK